jgi:hypothetical protein
MKIMTKSWKLISLVLVVGLLAAMIPMSTVMAAGTLTGVSDTLSNPAASASPMHTIKFTPVTAVPSGGTINITFSGDDTFTGLGAITTSDVTLDDSGTAAVASVSDSGQVLTITTDTADTSGAVTITIGDGEASGLNDITSPAAGNYTISIITKDGTTTLDTGYVGIAIGDGTGASVTVKSYISTTISDGVTADGVDFGEVDPDADIYNPDADQTDTLSSVSILVGDETNVEVDILGRIAGDWFVDGANDIPYANTKWSSTYQGTPGSGNTNDYSTSYAEIGADVEGGEYAYLWHWLIVPDGTPAGSYENTLYYQAVVSNS